jgi:trehalose 6-phosphate phosphatase
MIYLFSRDGTQFLEAVCFSKTLFAFDFDGTICEIVKEPGAAEVAQTTCELLCKLSDAAPTAVISGRGLGDLRKKLAPFPGVLVGNHGLEGIHSSAGKLPLYRKVCERWRKSLDRELLGKRPVDGIEIEDKAFSIAVHYRKSRSKKKAKAVVLEAVSGLNPAARIILGKCVVNVVPAGAPHKGIALLELMLKTGARSAFYIGDDDTDEDVFALPDPRLFTVRVGKKRTSRAKFYLQRQGEMNSLLRRILKNLESASE